MNQKAFEAFTARVRSENLGVEGVAVGDESRVLLEQRFTPDLPRNIYSHTKSYMATAVGLAISDGVLSLEDKLADLFPEAVPDNPPEALFRIRLRHLLTMSSGFGRPYLMGNDRRVGTGMPDYMKYMLSRPVEAEPGAAFLYSTADSHLAGRMVAKATGRNLAEYLYERIFQPLGQGWPIWENDPQGHPMGGGGMFLTLTQMMKLGQLYLAGGTWQTQRLVDPAWIRLATAKHIDTPAEEKNPWSVGYGYQFWMSPFPGAYRADGAYGQITTVLPEKGLVVAVQCPETGDFDRVRPALHELMENL